MILKNKQIRIMGLFVFALSLFMFISAPKALAAVKVWNGLAGDNKLATAGNWVDDAAPLTGDSLVFPKNDGASNIALTNDLDSGVCVNGITLDANGANKYNGYVISGTALSLSGTYTVTAGQGYNSLVLSSVSLCGDLSISSNSTLSIGQYDSPGTLAMSTYSITAGTSAFINIYSVITGSGSITGGGYSNIRVHDDSPAYSGAITSSGYIESSKANSLGTGAVTISSGGQLYFCLAADTVIANDISSGGDNALSVGCLGGPSNDITAELTGTITLTANTTSYIAGTLKISGPLHGNYTIGAASGTTGQLVIASSDNTSLTPNGTLEAPVESFTIGAGDESNAYVSVGNNQTYIIDGVRGVTTVGSGGILLGTGTVGELTVISGGTVSPGHSPGCLNTGNLTEGGTYVAEIGGTTACSGYDQLNVTGTVTLTGGTLTTSLYNSYKPKVNESYTFISNDGSDAVTGTFNNLPEGGTFSVNGYVLKISYVGGSGNDVVLTVVSVPAAPDTGFSLVKNNPLVTILVTVLGAVGIIMIARRYQKVTSKK